MHSLLFWLFPSHHTCGRDATKEITPRREGGPLFTCIIEVRSVVIVVVWGSNHSILLYWFIQHQPRARETTHIDERVTSHTDTDLLAEIGQ